MSFQTLSGFGLVETAAMMIGVPAPGYHYAPGRSLLGTAEGGVTDHDDRQAPLMLDPCTNKPIEFDPQDFEDANGMIALYNNTKGGYYPWDSNYYTYGAPTAPGFDKEFICRNAIDSAPTAGTLATGFKMANTMVSQDLYEQNQPTIVEQAMTCGKAGGAISSVSLLHATPTAFYSHSNNRNSRRQLAQSFEEVNPTYAMGVCGGSLHLYDSQYAKMRNGTLSSQWVLLEHDANGRNATNFYEPIQNLSPDSGKHVLGCVKMSSGNLPYRGLDSSYSNRYCNSGVYNSTGAYATTSATPCSPYSESLLSQIPPMNVHVREAVKFLGKSSKGFFLMYEQGDIDWAAHADHMDDMLGTMLDISDGVQEIKDWIAVNGGWEKNALYVTADHDHYLTLLPKFPELLANLIIDGKSYAITPKNNTQGNAWDAALKYNVSGASQTEKLNKYSTWTEEDILSVGHFWGPYGSGGNGWGSHTTRPVPIYYEGDNGCLEQFVGKNFTVLGKQVRGTPGKLSQSHVHACMLKNLFGLN
jgi:alkaline phosphatase